MTPLYYKHLHRRVRRQNCSSVAVKVAWAHVNKVMTWTSVQRIPKHQCIARYLARPKVPLNTQRYIRLDTKSRLYFNMKAYICETSSRIQGENGVPTHLPVALWVPSNRKNDFKGAECTNTAPLDFFGNDALFFLFKTSDRQLFLWGKSSQLVLVTDCVKQQIWSFWHWDTWSCEVWPLLQGRSIQDLRKRFLGLNYWRSWDLWLIGPQYGWKPSFSLSGWAKSHAYNIKGFCKSSGCSTTHGSHISNKIMSFIKLVCNLAPCTEQAMVCVWGLEGSNKWFFSWQSGGPTMLCWRPNIRAEPYSCIWTEIESEREQFCGLQLIWAVHFLAHGDHQTPSCNIEGLLVLWRQMSFVR